MAGHPDGRMVRVFPLLAMSNGADFIRPDGIWLVTIFCPCVWNTHQPCGALEDTTEAKPLGFKGLDYVALPEVPM